MPQGAAFFFEAMTDNTDKGTGIKARFEVYGTEMTEKIVSVYGNSGVCGQWVNTVAMLGIVSRKVNQSE